MSSIDLHPEELIDRYHAGTLDDDERRRLEAHCAACAACALELRLSEPLTPSAADAELVEGLLSSVIAQAPTVAPPGARWSAAAAMVAVLVLSVGGGAYAAVRYGWLPDPMASPPTVPSPGPRSAERAPRDQSPTQAVDAALSPAATDPTPEVETGVEPAPSEPPRAESAARPEALYAEANAARRAGEHRRALSLYRRLGRAFPRSRQARTAQVAAGNLALHELADPRAALGHFDTYLRASPSGPLALEARVGRALALSRLGRRVAERRAWQAILEHHPTSVHAERARRRLEELR